MFVVGIYIYILNTRDISYYYYNIIYIIYDQPPHMERTCAACASLTRLENIIMPFKYIFFLSYGIDFGETHNIT